MSALAELAERLRQQSGLRGKRDIQAPAATFPHLPFPGLGPAGALGDDAALLPPHPGRLLLACEGMAPALVAEDPWFAGWSAVLVNLSDIAAMGGRPLAVVNSLWCRDPLRAPPLLEGMAAASERFGVPVVGGHTNLQSPYDALSVAVLGVADGPVLSARSARPDDRCVLLLNTAGRFHRHYPFWDAATTAESERLRRQLALLPELAAAGLAHGAKDISMGGLSGTAVMFAEAAGCTLRLDLGAIAPPPGVELDAWLTCFPSFGFLLAVRPERLTELTHHCKPWPELACAPIGVFAKGPAAVELERDGEATELWGQEQPLTGFTALPI